MKYWMKVFTAVFTGVAITHFNIVSAKDNSSTKEDEQEIKWFLNLTITWMAKPPYVALPTNGSLDSGPQGLIRDTLLRYMTFECGVLFGVEYQIQDRRVNSEYEMIELLRQNKVHVAAPIFEPKGERHYSEFPFFKVVDYPGTDFLTSEERNNKMSYVLDAVLRSWTLLAVTLVLTAISGVIMWALDTYWNSEEFPRSFIKGSWDGFWWSFISMTTVGYGDKSPKSLPARIFSIVWILVGLIVMAIFTANVTTALTALTLETEPSRIDQYENVIINILVAVLGNGTEYQHAQQEEAEPIVHTSIDDAVKAVQSKDVDGIFIDHYTNIFYHSREKLKTLLTVKKLELQRGVGVLFSKDRKYLADCLNYQRSTILRSAQTITATYKLTKRSLAKQFSLFDDSSSFVKILLYILLGVLAGMLCIGIIWDRLIRKKSDKQKNSVIEWGAENKGMSLTERESILNDFEVAKRLLKQMQDHFTVLESKVSTIRDNR
ncbi:uncharacterized protein LOC111320785 [Stylophora pistillata]|uniref:uncharacterized protein LOC111320785 n=1 Tax=Stylophora pistillata TaxID=50429 RepID=UPI000C04A2C7|nr:uncharacterized protein LOC111320785 [Stylophora pistillata]